MSKCKRCDGTMWVCENHEDKPWAGESDRADACECGPGAGCPDCFSWEGFREEMAKAKIEGRLICSWIN